MESGKPFQAYTINELHVHEVVVQFTVIILFHEIEKKRENTCTWLNLSERHRPINSAVSV